MKRYLLNVLLKLFLALGMLWLVVIISLYFFQEKLLFFPKSIDRVALENIRQMRNVEEVTLTTPDGIKLRGWFVKTESQSPAPLLIYFGGNGDEVSSMVLELTRRLPGWAIALFNYRGYGMSEGQPGQDKIFADALSIFDQFASRHNVDKNKIVVIGRSLGSGVAVHLAAHRKLQGIVLVSPFDSVKSVAKKRYPFAPIPLLLKHPFDSQSYAPQINIPLLCLVAQHDQVIPMAHSSQLFKAWAGRKQWVVINNTDHNNIVNSQDYWLGIATFLKNL